MSGILNSGLSCFGGRFQGRSGVFLLCSFCCHEGFFFLCYLLLCVFLVVVSVLFLFLSCGCFVL